MYTWNVSLGDPHTPFLDLIKRSYHGWLRMTTSSEALFSLCLEKRANLAVRIFAILMISL